MRASRFLFRHPRGRLGLLLGGPLAWFLIVYFGSLFVLFLSSLWRVDVFTSEIVRRWGFQNFRTLWQNDVYRTITLRTVGIAAAVTVTDIVLAFPLAYYAARLATPRRRHIDLAGGVVMSPSGRTTWSACSAGSSSCRRQAC